MQKFRIVIFRAMIIATCLALPLAFFSFALLFAPFNPMQEAFINNVDFTNRSNQTLYVTVINSYEDPDSAKFVPRQFSGKSPAFEIKEDRNRPVQPSETLRIFYESDEYYLSEIAVSDGHGVIKQQRIDPDATGHNKIHLKPIAIEIDNISKMEEAADEVKKLTQTRKSPVSIKLEWFGWIPILLLVVLLWLKRRWIPDTEVLPAANWQQMPNFCKACQKGYDKTWKVCLKCGQPLMSASNAN